MLSLSDKLKSLGVKVGAQDLLPPQPRHARGIETVVPGREWPTSFGSAYVTETIYPVEYRHGRDGLAISAPLGTVASWARETRLAECAHCALAFVDTETTGLSGGTGTYAFLIGVGRYEPDSAAFRLTQFFMRDPAEEPAMLAALEQYLDGCEAVVTFNGKAFDVPLLNARYITNRRTTPFPPLAHLDLLPLARRLWRNRLPSRALGSLEVHILGAARTEQDVPGFLIPQMYFDYLRSGDARPLKHVLYHNAMDVVAMAALLGHVAQMIEDPLGGAVEHGLDLAAIARLYEELGDLERAAQLYRASLEWELPEEFWVDTVRRLAYLQRRRGDLAAAVELWRGAAQNRYIDAYVELAKYYEHQARDYALAAQWTRAALVLLQSPEASLQLRREWLASLEHRLTRLDARLSRAQARRRD